MIKLLSVALLATAFLLPQKQVGIVNMQQLKQASLKQNDTVYVINFWATWCKPCVHEMPFFETAAGKFNGSKVKITFVSLNSAKEAGQVKSFINQRQFKNDVLLLNAGNPNVWIDQIDSSWSGAIPATVMYKHGKKVFFYEGEFTQNQLDSVIQKQIL